MRAQLHEPLPGDAEERWKDFFNGERNAKYFAGLVGLLIEEVRTDYARMRLPYRPELNQPAGVVHGGAIATLIDTVVVPAVGSAYPRVPIMLTIDMQLRYLGAARECDLVAEGWITKRGKSTVFCQAEVRDPEGELIAEGWHTYRVIIPKSG
ncbi:PaaI family thioesterase [Actinocorallia aurantiaca]|uniref:Thioesterase domain-containing protein n=1 Tax=Actinocorallia aurantiaca TaxID=46204 RepID=A0ABN3UGE2_9ACTN